MFVGERLGFGAVAVARPLRVVHFWNFLEMLRGLGLGVGDCPHDGLVLLLVGVAQKRERRPLARRERALS